MAQQGEHEFVDLTINQSNAVFDPANGKISLPLRNKPLEGTRISLKYMSIPVSWRTITAAKQNNTFSVQLGATNLPIVLPDSNYELAGPGNSVNAYMEFAFDQANLWMVDSTGAKVYFIQLVVNVNAYRVAVVHTVVPAALPVGWADPNALIATYAGVCPQIVFDTSAFNTVLGGDISTAYPAVNTATGSLNLPNVPDVAQGLSVINLDTNFTQNLLQNNRFVHQFTWANVPFGSYLEDIAAYPVWKTVTPGTYSSLDITLTDGLGNTVPFIDTDITMVLTIRGESDSLQ